MNTEKIDALIEEISNHISESLKCNDLIATAEITKALAKLVSARALFKYWFYSSGFNVAKSVL